MRAFLSLAIFLASTLSACAPAAEAPLELPPPTEREIAQADSVLRLPDASDIQRQWAEGVLLRAELDDPVLRARYERQQQQAATNRAEITVLAVIITLAAIAGVVYLVQEEEPDTF